MEQAQAETTPWQEALPTGSRDTPDATGAATWWAPAAGGPRWTQAARRGSDVPGAPAARPVDPPLVKTRLPEPRRASAGSDGDGRGRWPARGAEGRGAEGRTEGRTEAPQREGTQRESGQRDGRSDNQRDRQNYRDDDFGGGRAANRYRDRQRATRQRNGSARPSQ